MKRFKRVMACVSILISMIVCLLFSGFTNIQAATFGVSASNNGNGSTTIIVSGDVAGGFQVTVNGQSTDVYINDIGGSASATIHTGAGTFEVFAKVLSATDKNYALLPKITKTTAVTVTNAQAQNPPIPNNERAPQTPNTPTTPNVAPSEKEKEADKKNKEEGKKATDQTLASLSVSKGTLSPKFNVATNVYTLNLTGDVTSIDVSAKANNNKATVNGTGNIKLKPGINKVVVSVTAENGTVKNYTINVHVDEKPLIYLMYNGTKLGIVRNIDDVYGPNKQFEKTKVSIDGKDVPAWKSNLLGKTVVYLIDEKTGDKNYYVYNTVDHKIETIFKPVVLLGHHFYIVDIDKKLQTREGMTYGTVKVDKQELSGWTYKDPTFKNYALIDVMNEKGNMVYYQYEATENTLQVYSGAAPLSLEEYHKTIAGKQEAIQKRDIVIYILSGASILLFVVVMLLFFFRKKKPIKYQKLNVHHKSFDKGSDVEAEALHEEEE